MPPAARTILSPELAERTPDAFGNRVIENTKTYQNDYGYRFIKSFSFSSDMRFVVTTGDTNDLQILALGRNATAQSLSSHSHLTYCVLFAPDSNAVAVAGSHQVMGGSDGSLRRADLALFDAESLALRTRIEPSGGIYCIDFSPDGRWLATGCVGVTNEIVVYDVESGDVQWKTSLERVPFLYPSCIAFSPDGKHVAAGLSGSQPQIRIWSLEDDSATVSYGAHETETGPSVTSVVFSSDGRTLISGGGDGKVRFSDSASGRLVSEINPTEIKEIRCLDLSPKGDVLAVARCSIGSVADAVIEVYDAETRRLLWSRRVPGAQFVAFTPDGNSIGVTSFHQILLLPVAGP